MRPDESHVERLLAEIDATEPTALETQPQGIRIFFGTADHRRRAALHLTTLDSSATCTPVEVTDEDWAERSQANLQPVQVGQLTIEPRSAATPTASPDPHVIVIHPSMGFGTGHHATTRRCLALLQAIPLAGCRVLDVGTGSGVLAIAAVRLGAASASGIDYDPDALVAARESVEANAVGDRVTLAAVDIAADPVVGAPFDVVVANLTGTLLTRQATFLAGLLGRDGHLIASGFMTDEQHVVATAFADAGLHAAETSEEDGWLGVIFTRRAPSTR
jgi:ribosomal protein L11 methyltransferase